MNFKIVSGLFVTAGIFFVIRDYTSKQNNQSSTFDKKTLEMVHLGTDYGGWAVPQGVISPDSICYCVGAGEDISLEVELANRYGCKVYTFDPTPRAVTHFEKVKRAVSNGSPVFSIPDHYQYQVSDKLTQLLNFYPYGLWEADGDITFFAPRDPSHVSYSAVNLQATNQSFQAPCKKLSSLMELCGHSKIDLLKMDIEGAEYAVLNNMLREKIYPAVLCIEFHGRTEDKNNMVSQLQSAGYKLGCVNKNTDYTFVYDA
jgi:FkbM family methyltransferase